MNLAKIQRGILSALFICSTILLAPSSAYGLGIVSRPPGDSKEVPWYVTLGTCFIMLLIGIFAGLAATWATSRPNIDTSRPNPDTPGMRLRLWCGCAGCSDDHVLVQLITDIQFEYHAAIRRGDFAAAQRIKRNGYIDFVRTLIVLIAGKTAMWVMRNLKNIFRAG